MIYQISLIMKCRKYW